MANEDRQGGDRPVANGEQGRPMRDGRQDEHWSRSGGPWIGGAILIALGVIFLARNFGFPMPENWWALFILLPALAAFSGAWSMYQRNDGQVTRAVVGSAVAGTILTVIAVVFLLGFDIGKFWPVILIAVGIGVLAGRGLPGRR